jgi:opacity protein-like surface antigen
MGGQDGFSRDMLDYTEESSTLMAGLKIHPSDNWDLGFNVGYTTSEGGLAPFDLPADDYVAITPPMSYDFSKSHTYSNIDVNRFNLDGMFKFKFTEDLWMRLWYKYVDFSDNDPYLYDTTGSVQWATITAGWSF